MSPVSLYVHVPFCVSKCPYCAFHSRACRGPSLEREAELWLRATSSHLDALKARFQPGAASTVYIGGGSPSVLPRPVLSGLLDAVRGFAGDTPEEFSVELNPEDVDGGLLSILADGGVDRLSLGVQSLEPEARRAVGRRGDAASVLGRLEATASRWKGRWSADLMYGLPGQTAGGLAADAGLVAGMGAGHVSLYELTVEPGTPLSASVGDGRVTLPDDDEAADQCDAASEALARAGLCRYEVSNWARPGHECRHNAVYWSMGNWLAVGPSAVGNLGSGGGSFLRMENSRDDEAYLADPAGSCSETWVTGRDAMFEVLMTALRTSRGLGLAEFGERFGQEPASVYGDLPGRFPGLIDDSGGRWAATARGLDTLNPILVAALRESEAAGGDKA